MGHLRTQLAEAQAALKAAQQKQPSTSHGRQHAPEAGAGQAQLEPPAGGSSQPAGSSSQPAGSSSQPADSSSQPAAARQGSREQEASLQELERLNRQLTAELREASAMAAAAERRAKAAEEGLASQVHECMGTVHGQGPGACPGFACCQAHGRVLFPVRFNWA